MGYICTCRNPLGDIFFQSYAPAPHPMAPPSPSTNSSNNSSNNSSGEQLSKTNLYIRGLPPGTTDQDLIKLCQPYGKIVSTKAILDKNTNQCKARTRLSFALGGVDSKAPPEATRLNFVELGNMLECCKGYGFVDFDSPAAAQKAVASLKANGVQAQMAKSTMPKESCKSNDHKPQVSYSATYQSLALLILSHLIVCVIVLHKLSFTLVMGNHSFPAGADA
ncbi:hypothetical protein Q9233_013951 [Columba guinea]|nr:hypothetical protein Q9233_013951 [Columba guinea]